MVGWDDNRLAMVLAVLEARCGVNIGANDVYLNVAGGLRISEPAADLAVAAAVVSSLADEPVPPDMAVFGEIGLGGEVRPWASARRDCVKQPSSASAARWCRRGRAGPGLRRGLRRASPLTKSSICPTLSRVSSRPAAPLKPARREGNSDRQARVTEAGHGSR